MSSYVAYYRVSTDKQGRSGLGLEAQQRSVAAYTAQQGGSIVAEFTEVESGRRKDRPELEKALEAAKRAKATLIVAKLDRLARNLHFITGLQESGVPFKAADFPEANEFMIHILAAVGQYEARLISERTKAGLASRKARGLPLGNLATLQRGNPIAGELKRNAARAFAAKMRPVIEDIRSAGHNSAKAIALQLNERGFTSAEGKKWHPTTVTRLLSRLAV